MLAVAVRERHAATGDGKAGVIMQQVEYRFEEIALTDEGSYNDQIVTYLNDFAKAGWRVVGIHLADFPHWSKKIVPVLMERETTAAVQMPERLATAGRT
jgi:hypothetical protein